MKKIYIYLTIAALSAIGLFIASFLYIDRQGHQTFLYAIYYDNILTGYEKTDRYLVENKLIYKSSVELPRDILGRKTTRKISFDARGKNFIDYTEETAANGAESMIYIKTDENTISFLGMANAGFDYLDHIPVAGTFTMFDSGDIVTYSPLIRRYNFKKRGEQFFNTITAVSPDTPPLASMVSITALGKDIIDIEGKKIRCENLVFELNSGDLISVWVAQTFHNVLVVKIPKTGFKAILRTKKDNIPVEEYTRKSGLYSAKEVMFRNGDIALSGILSVPSTRNGPYPSILLIWGNGPLDSTAMGMFTDIAHALAESGYCVLRFDKRGIGKSQGFFSTYDQSEEIADLKKAIEYLKYIPEVDQSRITVLGYAEGGFYAAYLAGSDESIKGCIIVSSAASINPAKNAFREMIKDKGDWITILGNSVFTKKIRMQDSYDIIETLKKIKTPVLILHGKKDTVNPPEEAEKLEAALSEGGNSNFTATYFGDLDHFMGGVVKNTNVRDHVEVAPSVIKSIVSWCNPPLPPEAK